MKLSIITINYNNQSGLETTISSVVSQTCRDFEWLVIDGGSTDGSRELIERYSAQIDFCVSEKDNGIYHAMNKGIKASHGDYIMFLNSGDMLHDQRVVESTLPLLVDKDIYVGRINSIGLTNATDEEQADFSPQAILRKLTFTWMPHQASFFKRSYFEDYGMLREDKKIVSDWWSYYRGLVIGQARITSLPITIADYDTTGASTNREGTEKEVHELLTEYPQIHLYYNFYRENYDIVNTLRNNRVAFFVYRIFAFVIRKISS